MTGNPALDALRVWIGAAQPTPDRAREIFRAHTWRHNSSLDGTGSRYGWTDQEIDALMRDLGVIPPHEQP